MRPLPPPRTVTLVLCRRDGEVLGAVPPFEVEVPWWQEVGPVVEAARLRHGIDVTILRLLAAAPSDQAAGGEVAYLAEVDEGPAAPLTPWPGVLGADEPLRASWARPGGPAVDLAWADEALARAGTPSAGAPAQVRTWNLSSLWRLPIDGGHAWLKVVPPFFAHEGAALSRLDPTVVPPLIATAGPRVLLAEVPGDDQYDASGASLLRMVELLVRLQSQWTDGVDELLALGLPDWRSEPLTRLLAGLVDRRAGGLDPAVARVLGRLVEGLPERWADIAGCGIPDSLVHGDFHRGNVRGTADRLVLLDWGDCGVGHPLLDEAAFVERMPAGERSAVRAAWARCWREVVPGCDPERAARLIEPVAALRQALIYQVFLDGIEPNEWIYHADDPARWLERAARLATTR